MMKKELSIILGVLVALITLNFLVVNYFWRFDLTKDQKYTLSLGSIETMKNLKDAMVVKAYFTQGMPAPFASYARYVRDLLDEYRSASNGHFTYEFVEPPAVESELMQLGVIPVELSVIEDDQQQTKRAYMGVVIRFKGKEEVIPVLQDFANFEKELTTRMRKLTRAHQPVIGLVNDLSSVTISKFTKLLGEVGAVREIGHFKLKEIPSDVDVLVVMGTGQDLSSDAIKAIDAFVSSGKNAAFFVDRNEYDVQTLNVLKSGQKGKLAELVKKHGVTIKDGLVADAQCKEILVQEERGSMIFGRPVRYPLFPSEVSGAVFPFASALTVEKNSTVLAKTSDKSWIEPEPVDTDPGKKWDLAHAQMVGPQILAVTKEVHGRLLVVGTSAFVWDNFLSEENIAFALTSIDYLIADEVMQSLHSRSFSELPLDADIPVTTRNFVKYGNMIGIPALLAAYGIFRWRRRELRRFRYCKGVTKS